MGMFHQVAVSWDSKTSNTLRTKALRISPEASSGDQEHSMPLAPRALRVSGPS
jgi:hypothetical protein